MPNLPARSGSWVMISNMLRLLLLARLNPYIISVSLYGRQRRVGLTVSLLSSELGHFSMASAIWPVSRLVFMFPNYERASHLLTFTPAGQNSSSSTTREFRIRPSWARIADSAEWVMVLGVFSWKMWWLIIACRIIRRTFFTFKPENCDIASNVVEPPMANDLSSWNRSIALTLA